MDESPNIQVSTTGPIVTHKLGSWEEFDGCIRSITNKATPLIFRGQETLEPLKSPFDRNCVPEGASEEDRNDLLNIHLKRFKRAVVGRRGPNPPIFKDPDDWWALGRHWGLDTPLLDWTDSPFIALFFAFEKQREKLFHPEESRVVFALSTASINIVSAYQDAAEEAASEVENRIAKLERSGLQDQQRMNELADIRSSWDKQKALFGGKRLKAVCPVSDENYRLINQRAWFVKCESGLSVEQWIEKSGIQFQIPVLTKILIPDRGREDCLRWLSSVNINHLTLFPDLYGASSYCNMARRIPDYFVDGLLASFEAVATSIRDKFREGLKWTQPKRPNH